MRRLQRGRPLEEVRGSLLHTQRQIVYDFHEQFGSDTENEFLMIEDIFSDHVVARSDLLERDQFYYVTYERDMDRSGEHYVFASRDEWEKVELAYVPSSVEEDLQEQRKYKSRFVERIAGSGLRLVEAAEGGANPDGPWQIRAIGVTADVVNANGRRYPAAVLEAAVERLQTHLSESAGQGRLMVMEGQETGVSMTTGESDHPSDKGNRGPQLLETVVNWTGVEFDGRQVVLEGNLLGTGKGKDLRALMRGGVVPGVSQRGYGEARMVDGDEGDEVLEVEFLEITGYDLTAPWMESDPEARITFVSCSATGW